MKNNGGAAFPSAVGDIGMSLRDWFAGQAESAWIQALAQRRNEPGYSDESAAYEAARLAVISADAMLAEREKE